MQTITVRESHPTSITLRPGSRRRFRAALQILRRNGVEWSESELLRRLAKVYLRHWRGRDRKSATARRYNRAFKGARYERVAWYADRVLYSVLWQRAIHSGESISRMLDFAIRAYLPRLLEEYLRNAKPDSESRKRNSAYWTARFTSRRKPQPDLFITYQCRTELNSATGLKYVQEYIIHRKNTLTSDEIFNLMFHAT